MLWVPLFLLPSGFAHSSFMLHGFLASCFISIVRYYAHFYLPISYFMLQIYCKILLCRFLASCFMISFMLHAPWLSGFMIITMLLPVVAVMIHCVGDELPPLLWFHYGWYGFVAIMVSLCGLFALLLRLWFHYVAVMFLFNTYMSAYVWVMSPSPSYHMCMLHTQAMRKLTPSVNLWGGGIF